MAGVSSDAPDAPVYLWVNPKYETPDLFSEDEAVELLRQADLVFAHSAMFEQAMTWGRTQDIGVRIKIDQWRCTAATARKAGLPYSLEKCAEALNLPIQKDKEGKRLIKLFSVPQEDGTFADPRKHPEDWYKFGQYCKTDVRVEKLIGAKLKAFELTGGVLDSFLFDLRMNLRGLPINLPAARNAQKVIDSVQSGVTEEFRALTGLNPTQREKVREMTGMPDMQAETVAAAVKLLEIALAAAEVPPAEAHRKLQILRLYSKLSYAAAKKVQVMLDSSCDDSRVRGGHLWYGTVPGRHSGRGLQPQNFKKTPPWMRPITHKVYQAICDGMDAETLSLLYGEPLELISGCIRHFIHKPGTTLFAGDYSAIQARIICWLAGQIDVLDGWRKGKDMYKWMAAHIYTKDESAVTPDEREVGKRVILGGGFGMGPPKFQSSCLEQYGLDLPTDLCERGIAMFRKVHDKVRDYWYFLDRSARSALANPGDRHGPFTVKHLAGLRYLLATLPSGRSIAYPHPEIVRREPNAEEKKRMAEGYEYDASRFQELTYWGNVKGEAWGRVKLYGGKLAENITMGCEADLMNHGMIVAEKRGYEAFMVVHDEALALRSSAGQSAEEYAKCLADAPPWAAGLPIKVEAKEHPFYQK